jgi:hypothetical protein
MCLVLISGMNTTAGCGVAALNSALSASVSPKTLRAYSITATCFFCWGLLMVFLVAGGLLVGGGCVSHTTEKCVAHNNNQQPHNHPSTHLHAEADAQVGHAPLARVFGRQDLALDAAAAKAARHEHAVGRAQRAPRLGVLFGRVGRGLVLQVLRLDPVAFGFFGGVL